MSLERVDRLVHERDAIREKQDALHPIAAHEQLAERNHRARLAGAGRHDDQSLALAVALECFRHAADRTSLVMPLDDRSVDGRACKDFARAATLYEQL